MPTVPQAGKQMVLFADRMICPCIHLLLIETKLVIILHGQSRPHALKHLDGRLPMGHALQLVVVPSAR